MATTYDEKKMYTNYFFTLAYKHITQYIYLIYNITNEKKKNYKYMYLIYLNTKNQFMNINNEMN